MDGHKNCQNCLDTNTVKSVCRSWDGWRQTVKSVQVMSWTNTLSNVYAGHEIDGHKCCQKCLRSWDGWTQTLLKVSAGHEMAWHIVKSVWGHEMDEHKHCQKCLQVMRWKDTNTVKSVCRSWDGRTQTLLKASAGHEMNTFVKCVCRSWDVWTNTVNSNT